MHILKTAGVIAAVGTTATMALDLAIDSSGHDHSTFAYRAGEWPTRTLSYAAIGLGAVAGAALLLPATRAAAKPIGALALATGLGLAATWGVRNLYGMARSPSSLEFDLGDVAKNSVDRCFMMDRDLKPFEHPVVDLVSRLQGHGPIDERIANGEFVERWTPGGRYDSAGELVHAARADG